MHVAITPDCTPNTRPPCVQMAAVPNRLHALPYPATYGHKWQVEHPIG